jgi:hypothetical protein
MRDEAKMNVNHSFNSTVSYSGYLEGTGRHLRSLLNPTVNGE